MKSHSFYYGSVRVLCCASSPLERVFGAMSKNGDPRASLVGEEIIVEADRFVRFAPSRVKEANIKIRWAASDLRSAGLNERAEALEKCCGHKLSASWLNKLRVEYAAIKPHVDENSLGCAVS